MFVNNPDELKRMQELMSYGINESIDKPNAQSCIEYSMVAADGKTYGIIRENRKFYIKVAPKKNSEVLAEDFNYLGGENNKKQYEYTTYNAASKNFDLKMASINEAHSATKVSTSQFKEKPESDWQTVETQEIREEINRFNDITNNVQYILAEDKSGLTMKHTLPEAPASNPSDDKVNSPFTDTAVANGDKDFKQTSEDHEKSGAPFNKDGNATSKDMQSDKNHTGEGDDVYKEKAQYVPDGSVANQKPNGGKVVRTNESKVHHLIKITEEQVLAWSKSKDFMDKTNGTEIGNGAPYDDNASAGNVQESETVHNTDNQNLPSVGTSETGEGKPYDETVNESYYDFDNIAGFDDDIPFPDAGYGSGNYDDDDLLKDFDISKYDLGGKAEKAAKSDMSNEFDFDDDFDEKYADGDYDDSMYEEGKQFRGRRVNEGTVLNDFGKHPAYRKKPMTTPPSTDNAKNGARDWNHDSAKSEQPFGQRIGNGAPFDEKVLDMLTDAIMSKMGFLSKA